MSTATMGSAAAPDAPAETPAIWTRDLTKRYGELTAVDRLNLEIKPGEIFGPARPERSG
jgi:ABC-2 type transport system ATP-binding protein